MLRGLCGPVALLLAGAAPATDTPANRATTPAAPATTPIATPVLPADQAAFRAHVMFLASDALKGREAGTSEYDIAAQYVAAQFFAAGLRPGGDKTGETRDYLQRVPLIGYKPADKGDFVLTGRDGVSTPLVFGADYVPAGNPAAERTVRTARVVFVGQGVVAPRYRRDDYKGVDVRGRIVAFTDGAGAIGDPEERAHFGRAEVKAKLAAARGAVGYLLVSPGDLTRVTGRYADQRVTWADPSGFAPRDGAPGLGRLGLAGADKLFGPGWLAAKKPPVSAATLAVAIRTTFEPLPSSNVVGVLPGSDPKLRDDYVVLSAHLDHVGICPEVAGDTICNGAEDNATGIAALIEEAKRFKAADTAPRRSIVFVAVTAEEKGLIGADYFARHTPLSPGVPIERIVANVNLDMPLLTYLFEDMTVYGANRSTLGPIVAAAAGSVGVVMSPDPAPEMGLFVRSDHYRFVQQGVPSVFLWPGQKGPGKAAWEAFFATRYHRPSDDLSQPIDWAQAVRFVGVNYTIARAIADADARPVWNKGDFFGTTFRGPMAR